MRTPTHGHHHLLAILCLSCCVSLAAWAETVPPTHSGVANLVRWSPQRELTDRATATGPSLAARGNLVTMAWGGTEWTLPFPIYVATSTDGGKSWSQQKRLGIITPLITATDLIEQYFGLNGIDIGNPLVQTLLGITKKHPEMTETRFDSFHAPGLAVLNGKFVMAWDARAIWSFAADSTDGRTWGPQRLLASEDRPFVGSLTNIALASADGLGVMAWGAYLGNIWVATSKDGGRWSKPMELGDRSGGGIALAAKGSGKSRQFTMAWEAGNIYVSTSSDGIHWTPQRQLSDRASPVSPPALVYSERLGVWYMAWEGVPGLGGTSANIYVSYSRDGLDWSHQVELNDRSTVSGPALVAVGDTILMAWRGSGENNIWTSVLQP
jgi:hypothetical protein